MEAQHRRRRDPMYHCCHNTTTTTTTTSNSWRSPARSARSILLFRPPYSPTDYRCAQSSAARQVQMQAVGLIPVQTSAAAYGSHRNGRYRPPDTWAPLKIASTDAGLGLRSLLRRVQQALESPTNRCLLPELSRCLLPELSNRANECLCVLGGGGEAAKQSVRKGHILTLPI